MRKAEGRSQEDTLERHWNFFSKGGVSSFGEFERGHFFNYNITSSKAAALSARETLNITVSGLGDD